MIIPSFLTFCFLSIFAICVSISAYSFPLRRSPAIKAMMAVLLSCALIAFFALLVYISETPQQKEFFSRMRFIGYAGIGPFWLLFIALSFNRWPVLRKPWALALLLLSPLTIVTCTLIPPLQDLVVHSFEPYSSHGLNVVRFQNGLLFYPHIFASYLCVLASGILSVQVAIEERENRRLQVLAIFSGAFFPILLDNYCYMTNSPLRWLMVNGASFIIMGAAIAWSVFKFHFLDLSTLAIKKVFKKIPDPIVYIDSDSRLRGFNSAAEEVFGLEKIQVGMPLNKVLPDLDFNKKEFALCDSSGNGRNFFLHIESLCGNFERHFGNVLLFRDITSQKIIENGLNQTLDFKARLLELISHDMAGNLKQQVSLSNRLSTQSHSEMKSTAHLLNDSATATYDLMENVMNWAKSQDNCFTPRSLRFEVNTLLKDCASVLKPLAGLHGITIHSTFEKPQILASGDSEMLGAVLRNLISNAIRASNPKGKIELRVEEKDESFIVYVKDFGTGMDQETVLALNHPQFNQETKRSSNGRSGYGVGLKIVRRFVSAHSGEIFFESQIGRGTTARLKVPLKIPSRKFRSVSDRGLTQNI